MSEEWCVLRKFDRSRGGGRSLFHDSKQRIKTVFDDETKYVDKYSSEFKDNAMSNGFNESKSYTDMKFETFSYDIKSVRKEARQAAAVGLAVSNLRYFDEPGSLSVSFGSGAWRGQSAFALGAGYTSENGKIRSNLSATSAGGHWGIGGAITLKIK
ncbi:YadA-like family protein [Bartonella sp. AP213QHHD]|uniref:YadA-like family protein n=1 Tax=Bartonella sp. AP213QHHD TaxID=3243476 RepID=UPI0035D127E7